MVSTGWLSPESDDDYHADIYVNNELVDSVEDDNGYYHGEFSGTDGEVKVCGTVTSAGTESEEACFVALKR